MSEFTKRLITGIELVIIIILLPIFGQEITVFAILLLSIIGLHEFYNIFIEEEAKKYFFIAAFFTIAYFYTMRYFENYQELAIAFFIMTFLAIPILKENVRVKTSLILITGFFYIPFLLYNLAPMTKEFFWMVFIIAFGTDTFAFVGGNLFGKHKLSPHISPKKTIEGFLTGILGALLLVYIYSYFLNKEVSLAMVIPVIIASIFGQLGDLVASKFKRSENVKDFGKIFPGHGGVLDRFDSVLFVAPVVRLFFGFFFKV
ncbi:MAG: phosphatidate cytidylyltransferase [Tissierellia bacterium]|nr:phosphatidate cytidylyltransferase [Tissierellia bacterium]